jgi:cobyrinic acid a,c-diamide synthase
MGLVPHQERDQTQKAIEWACNIVEENLNMRVIKKLAQSPEPIRSTGSRKKGKELLNTRYTPRIGYIIDGSFWFYYPENLEQLKRLGAYLIEIDSLVDNQLPELDGLYIGGGFPETRAKELAANESFRISLKEMIKKGLPVYAECGGLIYLGQELEVQGVTYPMVGALPIRFIMDSKPQGHGYTILEVDTENAFFRKGDTIKGHEFHYSKPVIANSEELNTVLKVVRGRGIAEGRDGIVKNNLFATYTHIHAGGNKTWAESYFKKVLKNIEEE